MKEITLCYLITKVDTPSNVRFELRQFGHDIHIHNGTGEEILVQILSNQIRICNSTC